MSPALTSALGEPEGKTGAPLLPRGGRGGSRPVGDGIHTGEHRDDTVYLPKTAPSVVMGMWGWVENLA